MKWIISVVAVMVLYPAFAITPAEREVLEFEKQRCDAVLHRDITALNAMLTDDLTYVHASGLKHSKQQYLDYVAAGKVTYTSYAIDNPVVHFSDSAAVTHGIFKYEIANVTPSVHGSTIYTAVYVHTSNGWKLSAWQATFKQANKP